MEDLKKYKVDKLGNYILDIAAGPFGSNLKVECFVPYGFPIIDGANLKGFKVTDNVSKFVTVAKARSLNRSIAKRNDVIVTISGNVGQISYIPEDSMFEEYLVSQRQFRATFDTNRVCVPYLVYYFHTLEGQHKILSFANQTGVPALAQPLKNFKNIDISLPPISEQYRIAEILKSLDDKIEMNRRINDNLEQQAQALFKSWFVDFEPFKDGEFAESELGMIPKGWRVISLEDIIIISKKTVNPGKYPDTQFFHYSIPAYDNGMNPEVQLGKEILSNKFTIMDKMTLFSKLNPRIKRVWFIDNVVNESICSTEFVPYIAKNTLFSSYVYSLINSEGFYDFVMSLVNGATGSHQRFHPNETLSYMIPFNDEIVLKYSHIVNPILTYILNNREESRRLAELRDSLLPRLMSGELNINDVENDL